MSDLNDLAAATSAIADPTTSAADLATIVGAHPSLRAAAAQHPNVYPSLLDWLDGLGDPTVSSAVASRRDRDTQALVPAPVVPVYGTTNGYAPNGSTNGYAPNGTTNGYAPPQFPAQAFVPMLPTDRTRHNPTRGSIITAVLFFLGAVLELVQLAAPEFDVYGPSIGLCPWGWASSFFYLSSMTQNAALAITACVLTVLVLIGCGVVSLVIGTKDMRRASFLIGVILSCTTLVTTIIVIVGMSIDSYYPYYGYWFPWDNVIRYLVFLAIPVVVMLMAKVSSQKLLDVLRTVLIIAIGTIVVSLSIIGYSVPGYYNMTILFSVFIVNIGNMSLFAALLILAFTIPNLSPQTTKRNMMLVVASALAVAEGMTVLIQIVYAIESNNFGTHVAVNTVALICGAYMIVAGILGFVYRSDHSKAQLLLGLGIGLVVAQTRWFVGLNWLYNIVFVLGFLAVAILYFAGATTLSKSAIAQPYGGQPYLVQQYAPGVPQPVQQYAPGVPQPYIAGQPQPYATGQPQAYNGQPYMPGQSYSNQQQ